MKAASKIYLLWAAVSYVSASKSFEPYYGDEFVSYVEGVHRSDDGSVVMQLFRSLDLTNSTDLCVEQLRFFRDSALTEHQQWAVSMLDSSDGSGAGWLSGNIIGLGDYDGCLSSSPPKRLKASYCLVTLELPSQRSRMDLPWAPHDAAAMSSVCLPGSCTGGRLESLLRIGGSVGAATVACRADRTSSFSTGELVAVCFFLVVWFIALSTFIPRKRIPIKGFRGFLDAFDIRENLRALLATRDRGQLLSSLDGIRFFSQCFIIVYHALRNEMFPFQPVLNKFYFYEFLRSWKGVLYVRSVLSVDTFFLLSGILLTWNMLEKRKNIGVFDNWLLRYLRLTPAYMAVVLFEATILDKFCDGPFCGLTTEIEKNHCSNHWWTNALYISNFYPGVSNACVPQAWYLSAEWQLFFFLSPFVAVLLRRRVSIATAFIAAVFLSSMAYTFALSYAFKLPMLNLSFTSFQEADRYYDFLYTTPFSRAGPWAVGMLFGVFLHNVKKDPVKLSKTHLLAGWVLAGLGFYFSLVTILPPQDIDLPGSQGNLWNSFYNAFQGNVWALSVCWVIFCCGVQTAGFIGSFLCWPGFQPLAKLTYCAYLVHMSVLFVYYGERRVPSYVSLTAQIPVLIGLIFISFMAALLLHVSFEAPTERLVRLAFAQKQPADQERFFFTTEMGLGSSQVGEKKEATQSRNSRAISTLSNDVQI